jgi:UDP-glucose-4-epimerase GalE
MRVLVTGGSGYIGSATVRELVQNGHSVIIYDNLSTGHRKLSKGFDLIEGDIADRSKILPALERVDAIIHFAASAYVGESVTNPRKYFRNNVESALALMDSVLETDLRVFIFSSSCAVYGLPHSLPICESSPKDPINPYGATKLFFERVLSAYSVSHGLRFAALRYFNAAGAHPIGTIGEIHNPETHLIPLAIRATLGVTPPLTVFGQNLDTPDGTCVRDFVHVADLASAHVKALEYLAHGGMSIQLNLGAGIGISIKQLIRAIEEVSGRKVPHLYAEARPGDPPSLFADAQRAKDVLNWQPQYDLKQIVTDAIRWEENLAKFLQEP